MDFALIFNFIDPRLLIVVTACWAIGFVLKQTPRVPDWSIVYIVTLLAVVFAVGSLGWGTETVIQGVLCGAFAVYGNQIVKQAKKVGDDQ